MSGLTLLGGSGGGLSEAEVKALIESGDSLPSSAVSSSGAAEGDVPVADGADGSTWEPGLLESAVGVLVPSLVELIAVSAAANAAITPVYYGEDPATLRPENAQCVLWIGLKSVEPENALKATSGGEPPYDLRLGLESLPE